MQRDVSTTVRVKLHSLTNRKAHLLAREYEAFQTEVHRDDDPANLPLLVDSTPSGGTPRL